MAYSRARSLREVYEQKRRQYMTELAHREDEVRQMFLTKVRFRFCLCFFACARISSRPPLPLLEACLLTSICMSIYSPRAQVKKKEAELKAAEQELTKKYEKLKAVHEEERRQLNLQIKAVEEERTEYFARVNQEIDDGNSKKKDKDKKKDKEKK